MKFSFLSPLITGQGNSEDNKLITNIKQVNCWRSLPDMVHFLGSQSDEACHGCEPCTCCQKVKVCDITKGAETEGTLGTTDRYTVA